jgi:ATP cone domain-containing protein
MSRPLLPGKPGKAHDGKTLRICGRGKPACTSPRIEGSTVPEETSPALPAWVYKRDGRLVPFEPDKISQALFATSETLGRPDAFLARELTDGVLHFLAREFGGIPATSQIAELVIKVVRELGQSALARAFEEGRRKGLRSIPIPAADKSARPELRPAVSFQFSVTESPEDIARKCMHEYSLEAIFSRDLAAAHRDGLLTVTGLDAPLQLAGCVLGLSGGMAERGDKDASVSIPARRSGALVQALLDLRRQAGTQLTIDSPEYALSPFAGAGDLARNSGEFLTGLKATGLVAVVNLNCTHPPGWAEDHAEGPLFAEQRRPTPPAHLDEYRTVILEQLLRPAFAGWVRIIWHLGEADFAAGPSDPKLSRLVRWALESANVEFTFDRPARPVNLGEGMDRKHGAVLAVVGLNLPRLLDLPGVRDNAEQFLLKLPSLARMAVSAGVQKRNFLRRRNSESLSRGFLLDRSRLVAVPVGLEAAVRALTGGEICSQSRALELARQAAFTLAANLRQAGHAASLDVCLDNPCFARLMGESGLTLTPTPMALGQIAGLTPWCPDAPVKEQARAAGTLQEVCGTGTAAILLQGDTGNPDDLAALLHWAWKKTELVRIRFLHLPHQQAHLSW